MLSPLADLPVVVGRTQSIWGSVVLEGVGVVEWRLFLEIVKAEAKI